MLLETGNYVELASSPAASQWRTRHFVTNGGQIDKINFIKKNTFVLAPYFLCPFWRVSINLLNSEGRVESELSCKYVVTESVTEY